MMYDLTPILMGDPVAGSRRSPTAAEIERQGRLLGYEPKRLYRRRSGPRPPPDRRLLTLAIGQTLHDMARSDAETARAWLVRNKMHCKTRVQPDGRYRLWRTR